MDLGKNENDQLPEEAIEARAKTYQGMMTFGYVWGLPGALAIVMLFTMLLLGVGVFNPVTWLVALVTFVAVMIFSKTFFVH